MGTVSCRYIKSYFNTCVAMGCDPEKLLDYIGEGANPFDNPNRRFSNEIALGLLHLGEKLTGDSSIAIEAGKAFRPSTFFDIGLAFTASNNLRQALAINSKYQALTQQFGKTHLTVDGATASISWRPYKDDPDYMRPGTEAAFAGYAVFGRWLTWLYDQEMAGMRFRHARPAHHKICEDLFACEISYNDRIDAMILDASIVDMKLPNANPRLLKVVCERLDKAIALIDRPPDTKDSVHQIILATLHKGPITITQVAAALDLSERTLRRKLADEGASFRAIMEEARKEACEIYIREKRKTIAEIAEALGYSEQSAFARAYRKWYGKSPSDYINTV